MSMLSGSKSLASAEHSVAGPRRATRSACSLDNITALSNATAVLLSTDYYFLGRDSGGTNPATR